LQQITDQAFIDDRARNDPDGAFRLHAVALLSDQALLYRLAAFVPIGVHDYSSPYDGQTALTEPHFKSIEAAQARLGKEVTRKMLLMGRFKPVTAMGGGMVAPNSVTSADMMMDLFVPNPTSATMAHVGAMACLRLLMMDALVQRRLGPINVGVEYERISQEYTRGSVTGESIRVSAVCQGVSSEITSETEFPISIGQDDDFFSTDLRRDLEPLISNLLSGFTTNKVSRVPGDPIEPSKKHEGFTDAERIELALRAPFSCFRMTIIDKVVDQSLLAELAKQDTSSDTPFQDALLAKVTDRKNLADIALNAQSDYVRISAASTLNDNRVYMLLTEHDKSKDVRIAAASKLADPASIRKVAFEADDEDARIAAISDLTDQVAHTRLAEHDKSKNIRIAAVIPSRIRRCLRSFV